MVSSTLNFDRFGRLWFLGCQKAILLIEYIGYLLAEGVPALIIGVDEQIEDTTPRSGLNFVIIFLLNSHSMLGWCHSFRMFRCSFIQNIINQVFTRFTLFNTFANFPLLIFYLRWIDEWIIERMFSKDYPFVLESFIIFFFEQKFLIHLIYIFVE